MNDGVEICPICDIAGCRHIRERDRIAPLPPDTSALRVSNRALRMAVNERDAEITRLRADLAYEREAHAETQAALRAFTVELERAQGQHGAAEARGYRRGIEEARRAAMSVATRSLSYDMRGPDGTWLPGSPYDQGFCEGAIAVDARLSDLGEKE